MHYLHWFTWVQIAFWIAALCCFAGVVSFLLRLLFHQVRLQKFASSAVICDNHRPNTMDPLLLVYNLTISLPKRRTESCSCQKQQKSKRAHSLIGTVSVHLISCVGSVCNWSIWVSHSAICTAEWFFSSVSCSHTSISNRRIKSLVSSWIYIVWYVLIVLDSHLRFNKLVPERMIQFLF